MKWKITMKLPPLIVVQVVEVVEEGVKQKKNNYLFFLKGIWDLDIFEASPFDKLIEDNSSFQKVIDTEKLVQEIKAEHEGLLKL